MNFLQAYKVYTKETEPPQSFQAWTAISVCGALLGRKCYMPMGHFNVYPNMYVLLVGNPGTRKSTALQVGRNLLRAGKQVPVAASSTTRESLIEAMTEDSCAVKAKVDDKLMKYQQLSAFVGEFAEFIGGRHISEDMVRFMTGIWDEDVFEYKTKNKGKFKIYSPFFTMLGACTPDWIIRQLKADIVSDGFSRRTIFVHGEKRNCLNPRPILTPEMIEARSIMNNESKRIHSIVGEFCFSKEATTIFDKFYKSLEEVESKAPDRLKSYFSTKPNLVQKVAMCISAGISSSRVIDSKILNATLTLFEQNERYLYKLFGAMGRNELKAELVKVTERIQAAPKGITKKDLVLDMYGDLNQSELTEVLEILAMTGEVRAEVSSTGVDLVYFPTSSPHIAKEVSQLQLISQLTYPEEDPVIPEHASLNLNPLDLVETQSKDDSSSEKPLTAQVGGLLGKLAKPHKRALLVKGKVVNQVDNPTSKPQLDSI